jgi:RNA polymerase sigma-70 factor (ECF subfamily)
MTDLPLDLAAIHRIHRTVYVRWAERRLQNRADAEEAVDQAFEVLARSWQDVLSKENPAAYAWQVMRNRTIDYARARGRRACLIETAAFETAALRHATDPIEELQESLHIFRAIETLSDRQQDVFVLLHCEGHTTTEVATHLGITEAGVRSLDRHARRHLRGVLAAAEREGDHP